MLLKLKLAELWHNLKCDWPLVLWSTYERGLSELSEHHEADVKRIRANAQGMVDEYNKLEDRKNQFVDQNLKLRAALNESQEQVKNLTIALHTVEQTLAANARSDSADRQCGQGGG